MANVVVEEGQFNRMRNALREWNARRPAGEAEAIDVYKKGHKGQGMEDAYWTLMNTTEFLSRH